MAFGASRGTLTANGASQVDPSPINGNVANVAVGDLVYAVWGQQTGLTVGVGPANPTDNLGNTYAWCNAGNDPGTPTARAAWSIVTTGGTLTQVRAAATASSNNYANFAQVIEGPFRPNANQPAANPANTTNDITSPFTCPATGTLPQASCKVMAFYVCASSATFAATSPNLLAGQATSSTLVATVIGHQTVSSTSSVSPEFTGTNPAGQSILGTTAFAADTSITGTLAATEAQDTASFAGSLIASGSLAATEAADVAAFAGSLIASGTLSATETQDTALFAGQLVAGGTLEATEPQDTAAFAGEVTEGSGISGTLAVTEEQDVAAFAGALSFTGTLAATEAQDAATFAGALAFTGVLAAIEDQDTASFAGQLIVTGTLAATEEQDVALFSEQLPSGDAYCACVSSVGMLKYNAIPS